MEDNLIIFRLKMTTICSRQPRELIVGQNKVAYQTWWNMGHNYNILF